eukprot:2938764-Amphidinium_carterae.1
MVVAWVGWFLRGTSPALQRELRRLRCDPCADLPHGAFYAEFSPSEESGHQHPLAPPLET